MFDDVNYTNQEDIDWGNATTKCNNKDGGGTQLCDYSKYPRVGERIKTCFEARNYFSDEVFIEMFDIYIDNDKGDTTHFLVRENDFIEFGLKSIQDNDLYLGNAPSRAFEADGNLLDGYANFCTDWIELPDDLVGGNNWDVQGHVTLDPFIYSLEGEKVYTWESDEFPIFGDFASQPTWAFSALLKDHYNIPEQWSKSSDNQFNFNFNITSLSSTAGSFDFGEHLPLRLLDESTPIERIVNVSLTYQNGSATSLSTELLATNTGEIVFFINNVNLSKGDNNFTITANTHDYSKRGVVALEGSRVALEGIENKTGTFHLDVNCPSEGEIGKDIACTITAYVEDSQTVQKEVDFTCYITHGNSNYSAVNFNQMVTKNAVSINQNFLIPSILNTGTQYTLQCHADYYNLGSRRDSFYDTFTASNYGSRLGRVLGVIEARNGTITIKTNRYLNDIKLVTKLGIETSENFDVINDNFGNVTVKLSCLEDDSKEVCDYISFDVEEFTLNNNIALGHTVIAKPPKNIDYGFYYFIINANAYDGLTFIGSATIKASLNIKKTTIWSKLYNELTSKTLFRTSVEKPALAIPNFAILLGAGLLVALITFFILYMITPKITLIKILVSSITFLVTVILTLLWLAYG